jgi:UPF0755 protein
MNKIVAVISAIFTVLVIWAWLDFQSAKKTPVVGSQPVLIEIEKGDSFQQITNKLIAQEIAINSFWFKIIATQNNAFKKLKIGEYELTPGLTMPGILALFVSGKTKQYAITFPEGWSFQQIFQEIEKNQNLEHTITNVKDEILCSQIGINSKSLEGELFPDTYFFEKHTSDVALLTRAYEKMQSVLQQEWQKRDENVPFKTPYEALILASIVEKETGVKTERPMIAGVFIRRLEQDMKLQTDPTVIYGMGGNYHGDITYQDLKAATAYNTYVNKGLPPTPIAMPGREAIVAVLHPDHSDSLYFVARGDGSHVFSSSLKAHNLAVNTFQRKK